MSPRSSCVVFTFLLAFTLFQTSIGWAQSVTAHWALTSDSLAVVTGNGVAAPQMLSDTMSSKDYLGGTLTAGSPVGATVRIWRSGLNWPNESVENINRYCQYSLAPAAGENLRIQSVALNIGCSGTSHFFATIYYSTDSTFATRTALTPAAISLPDIRTAPLTPLSYTVDVQVYSGQKFYLRIYPWYNAPASPTKYLCLTDVVVSGTPATPGSGILSVTPSALEFGTVLLGSRSKKTCLVSGNNLSPRSGSIKLTAPSQFRISVTGGTDTTDTLSLPYSGGTLPSTSLDVWFAPDHADIFTEYVRVTGGGALGVALFVTGQGVAQAAVNVYYVSPTGADSNTGTFDKPFQTIAKAVGLIQPGDTIFVFGGLYPMTSKISISKNQALADVRYSLLAYPGERPVLDFGAMAVSGSNRGIELGGRYWTIKGLDICNAGDNGMNISGSYNIIEFCSFYGNHDTGLQLGGGASNNRIINCDSYWNEDPGQGNADGFSPKLDVGTGNYFYGCRSWQNSDDGWDGYLRPSDNVTTTIENCWSFANGFLRNGTAGGGNGNGFKMGGSDAQNLAHNMILINCLAFDNLAKGFDQNHNRGSMTLYNCTGYGNLLYDFAINEPLDTGAALILANCLSYARNISLGSFAVQTTNSWQGITVTEADFVSPGGIDTTGARAPRKADGSLPDMKFMHLNPSGGLVDKGTNVGLPFNGTAPDLGCFESGGATAVGRGPVLVPGDLVLYQNYPNPFNPATRITFSLGKKGTAVLRVVDILGRQVHTAVMNNLTPGLHSALFDATALAPGVYFGVVEAAGSRQMIKMILMK